MENLPLQILIPIGVIMAALIAGFFSLLNLIISKEQKVSEFRQHWIDSLRQELSDHIAALVSLSSFFESLHTLGKDFTETESQLRQRVTSTFTSIKLRINPEDSDSSIRKMNKKVLRLLEEERALFNEAKWQEARLKCNEITNASIPMLKEEWKRVKRGENVYVWSKRVAIAIFSVSFATLIFFSYEYWPALENESLRSSEMLNKDVKQSPPTGKIETKQPLKPSVSNESKP